MFYKEGYYDLANAIIKKACEDYKTGKINDYSFKYFCRSGWFKILTKVDSEYLIKKMEKEREVSLYGKKEKTKNRYKK